MAEPERKTNPPMDEPRATSALLAIRRAKARYCIGVDRKDWARARSALSADSVLDFTDDDPTDEKKILRGGDTIIATVRSLIGSIDTIHRLYEPDISLTSATTATGLWPLEHRIVLPPDAEAGERTMIGWGYYHDEYALVDGDWVITCQRREEIGHRQETRNG